MRNESGCHVCVDFLFIILFFSRLFGYNENVCITADKRKDISLYLLAVNKYLFNTGAAVFNCVFCGGSAPPPCGKGRFNL